MITIQNFIIKMQLINSCSCYVGTLQRVHPWDARDHPNTRWLDHVAEHPLDASVVEGGVLGRLG